MRSEFQESIEMLASMGFNLACTPGTADYYTARGLSVTSLQKPFDGEAVTGGDMSVDALAEAPSVIDWIRTKKIELVINIPEGTTRNDEVTAGYLIRRTAVDFGVGLLTNIK